MTLFKSVLVTIRTRKVLHSVDGPDQNGMFCGMILVPEYEKQQNKNNVIFRTSYIYTTKDSALKVVQHLTQNVRNFNIDI